MTAGCDHPDHSRDLGKNYIPLRNKACCQTYLSLRILHIHLCNRDRASLRRQLYRSGQKITRKYSSVYSEVCRVKMGEGFLKALYACKKLAE